MADKKNINTNIKSLLIFILLFISYNSFAQNNNSLLAKAEINKFEMTHKLSGFDLYDNFNTEITHYKSDYIPNKFIINMVDFSMPIKHNIITSKYGKRWKRMHQGVDIKAYLNDTIYAAFPGKIRIVKNNPKGYGNFVVIRHYNGLETYYGHMTKQLVKKNQLVKAGEPIGLAGSTGRSTGVHLHFETRLCGIPIDPELLFDFKTQDILNDFYEFSR